MKSFSTEFKKLLSILYDLAKENNVAVYVVGGWVRDTLLRIESHDYDLDLVVEGDARDLAKSLAHKLNATVRVFDSFLTAKVLGLSGFGLLTEIDLASTRTESYLKPGALPKIELTHSLADDLKRRDFTINALAVSLAVLLEGDKDISSSVIDHFNGLEDLERKEVRILHDQSFIDDPTRIVRACRYAAKISGNIEGKTAQMLQQAVMGNAFQTISSARQFREIELCLEIPGQQIIDQLDRYQVLENMPLVGAAAAKDFQVAASFATQISDEYKLQNKEFLLCVLLQLILKNGANRDELTRALSLTKDRAKMILKLEGKSQEWNEALQRVLGTLNK